MRLSALEAIGGFETSFQTVAALDEVARACRRQGWRTVCARDCQLDQRAAISLGDEELIRQEREAIRALEEGDRLKVRGDEEGAVMAYRRAVESKGDFIEAILVLGALLLELGRPAEAVEIIARLVALDQQSVQGHNYLGLARYQAQDWEGARHSFMQVLELDPDHIEALVNLSVLEWEQGEADRALDFLERAAALDPANREVIVNTGLIHAQMGNAASAIALFQDYVRAHPEDLEACSHLADIMLQSGDEAGARQIAAQILELQPDHPRARVIVERTRGQEEETQE